MINAQGQMFRRTIRFVCSSYVHRLSRVLNKNNNSTTHRTTEICRFDMLEEHIQTCEEEEEEEECMRIERWEETWVQQQGKSEHRGISNSVTNCPLARSRSHHFPRNGFMPMNN